MYLSREAINTAHRITLPNQEQIFTFTDHDKKVWQKAFEWYNLHMNLPHVEMSNRAAYSKVWTALKKAKEFMNREEIL